MVYRCMDCICVSVHGHSNTWPFSISWLPVKSSLLVRVMYIFPRGEDTSILGLLAPAITDCMGFYSRLYKHPHLPCWIPPCPIYPYSTLSQLLLVKVKVIELLSVSVWVQKCKCKMQCSGMLNVLTRNNTQASGERSTTLQKWACEKGSSVSQGIVVGWT